MMAPRLKYSLATLLLLISAVAVGVSMIQPYDVEVELEMTHTEVPARTSGYVTYRATLKNDSAGPIWYAAWNNTDPKWMLEFSVNGGRSANLNYLEPANGDDLTRWECIPSGESVDFFVEAPAGATQMVVTTEVKKRWDSSYRAVKLAADASSL